MTVHPIVAYGEPVLHRRALPVTEFDEALRTLVADMRETLKLSNGVGLAAPQIGVGLRIFVFDAPDEDRGEQRSGVVVNPTIVTTKVPGTEPDPAEDIEGCLSVPSLDFPLRRAGWAKVTGVDEFNEPVEVEGTGWFARVLQHEYDHLDGIIYVDKLSPRWAKKAKKAMKREGLGRPGISWLPGVDPDPFGHGDD